MAMLICNAPTKGYETSKYQFQITTHIFDITHNHNYKKNNTQSEDNTGCF